MSKIIGIDLGTTNSVVAVMEGGSAKVLTNSHGARLTPSVVAITDKGERLVGQVARHQQVTNPQNTVHSIKRFMGRRHNEVGVEEKMVSYKVVGGETDLVKVEARGKQYTPPEISAMILQDLKKTAEDYLGTKVERAVITVPAYFNDSQRKATKDAGEIAGLQVERIINEPTAAALAFGLEKKKEQTVAVFDLGGGTFDISVLEIDPEVGTFEVKSTSGDGHLGGDDYDEELINFLAEEFRKQEGMDLRTDPMALQRLKDAAEKAKCELSTVMETNINLPYITATASGAKHLQLTITRSKFEQLTKHPDRAHASARHGRPLRRQAHRGRRRRGRAGRAVRPGCPRCRRCARRSSARSPTAASTRTRWWPSGPRSRPASSRGGSESDIVLLDITPLTLGVETLGGVMTAMIDANTTIPTSKTEVFSTASDGQSEVTVHVLQGNRPMAANNRSLGQFNLTGIPARSARPTPDRRHLRHRSQRHHQRFRQGQGHQQGAVHPNRVQRRLE